jgi:hypothetical protein
MNTKRNKKFSYNKVNGLNLVSDFMNLPMERAEKFTSHPVPMRNLVEEVWEDWGIGEEETAEAIISGYWQRIVGKGLSGKCAPIHLSKDGKTLQIRAASSTIKQELSFRKDNILKKIKSLKGCPPVAHLKIS